MMLKLHNLWYWVRSMFDHHLVQVYTFWVKDDFDTAAMKPVLTILNSEFEDARVLISSVDMSDTDGKIKVTFECFDSSGEVYQFRDIHGHARINSIVTQWVKTVLFE
jgi:hypothetical protein